MVVFHREEEPWDSITKSSVKLTTLSKELGITPDIQNIFFIVVTCEVSQPDNPVIVVKAGVL